MRLVEISFLIVFFILTLNLLPYDLETHENLNATNIQLTKAKLLAQNGDYPRWSPDGKEILYSILTSQGPEIWQMNSDGSEKKLVVSGVNANWSPDGDKIVFFYKRSWSSYSVSIYDLKQKKILYQDNYEFDLNGPGVVKGEFDPEMIHWYQNKIYVISSLGLGFSIPPMKRVWVLDLDTLKWQSSNERDYGQFINELNRNNKLLNLNIEQVPSYVIPHKALAQHYHWGPLEVPYFLRGIWAVNKNEEFSIKLLENATQPELSPNFDKLVFVKLIFEQANTYKTEVNVCELDKSARSNRILYEVELGTENGVKEGDSMIIAAPKINPLNNRIIGYSGFPKAIVTVSGVKKDTCLVFPNVIIQVFGVGDLAAYEGTDKFGPIKRIAQGQSRVGDKTEIERDLFNVPSDKSGSLFPLRLRGKVQYVDKDGNVRIATQYRNGGNFKEGRAFISQDGNIFGVIDDAGKVVVPPRFGGPIVYSEGLACVLDMGSQKLGYIDRYGIEVIPFKYALASNFSGGLAAVSLDYKSDKIFIDYTGKTILQVPYRMCTPFSEGLSAVSNFGGWGYIDKTGKLVIQLQFEEAEPFAEGLARVRDSKSRKFGFINKSGEYVIKPMFDNAGSFSEGLVAVGANKGNRWIYGYADKTGKIVIGQQFNNCAPFSEDLALVWDEHQKIGYIDRTGKFAISPRYDSAFPFDGGLALVSIDGISGYIDRSGTMKIVEK